MYKLIDLVSIQHIYTDLKKIETLSCLQIKMKKVI